MLIHHTFVFGLLTLHLHLNPYIYLTQLYIILLYPTFTWPHLHLYINLTLPSFVLPCLALSCLVLSCLALSCLALSCLVLPYLTLSYLTFTFTFTLLYPNLPHLDSLTFSKPWLENQQTTKIISIINLICKLVLFPFENNDGSWDNGLKAGIWIHSLDMYVELSSGAIYIVCLFWCCMSQSLFFSHIGTGVLGLNQY